ncbi:Translation initiation factor 3 subunit b [Irineochytrium annulatum]|nr:Translation initiation factor 3 subunit b [Irineochytrium annulatum]
MTRPELPDDEDEIDFSDIYDRFRVPEPTGFDSVIVVDNAPIVDTSKKEKLIAVIKKIFKNIGPIKETNMPMGDDGKSKGYIFMEFETAEQANMAVKVGDGHRLDAAHNLKVNKFDDIEAYANVPDVYEPPVIEPFKEKPHARSWLLDERARDQLVIMKGDDVSVYWNNKSEKPDLVYQRPNWSDMYVTWSPKGTYLTTFHKQGVVLWGGPGFEKIVRFAHPNVKLIDYSPDEKMLVSWSNEGFVVANGDTHHAIFWDIQSGRQLRSFPVDPNTMRTAEAKSVPGTSIKIDWPIFKWSHDSKYFARMATNMIQVYETPGMGLIDKKSIKVDNVRSFDWSPSDNYISYWTPEVEEGNIPARVTVMSIPSREIVRTKNMVSVISASLHWQSAGQYLLVRVERAKTKKSFVTNFEILRMKEKGIPVDVAELPVGESVTNVFWEPLGDYFAVISTDGGAKIYVHFYQMQSMNLAPVPVAKKAATSSTMLNVAPPVGVKLIRTVDRKGCNSVVWSPRGRVAILAGIRAFQGDLEFWDVHEGYTMGQGEHYMCTDVEWDPTGRYVLSSVSWWKVQTDPGFMLWAMDGTQLTRQPVPMLKQILWRPRPPSPLSEAEQKQILKDLKTYSKVFDKEDEKAAGEGRKDLYDQRLKMWQEWVGYRKRCADDWAKEAPLRVEIVGFDLEEDKKSVIGKEVEEYIDEVIEETEEIVEDEDYGDD